MTLDSRRARNLSVLSATRERGVDHCWHVVQVSDGVTLQRCVSEWQAQQRAADSGFDGAFAVAPITAAPPPPKPATRHTARKPRKR